MTTHSCPQCDYTTTRLFNLERHIQTRHSRKGFTDSRKGFKTSRKGFIDSRKGFICESIDEPSEATDFTCTNCGRSFTRSYSLKVHTETCDGTSKGCCPLCKQYFKNKVALCRHRKVCQGITALQAVGQPSQQPSVQNITIQNMTIINNNQNNNTQNNNYNILQFPQDDDTDFDFVTDDITQSVMKKCVSAVKAAVGFNRFMGAVLTHPQNQFILKSNPNVNYSKIHVGDGKWILAPDSDVYPMMTHHMTTAALAKLEEFKRSLRYMCDSFHSYVNTINTDDECKEYEDTIQRLKLMVVNMTKEIEAAEKDARIQSLQATKK